MYSSQREHDADDDDLIFYSQGKCTLEGVGPEKLLLAPVEHDRYYLRIYFILNLLYLERFLFLSVIIIIIRKK